MDIGNGQHFTGASATGLPSYSHFIQELLGPPAVLGQQQPGDRSREDFSLPQGYENCELPWVNRRFVYMILNHNSFMTRVVLPIKYSENPEIHWTVLRFNRSLFEFEPEGGVPRLTQLERSAHHSHMERRGIAIQVNRGFACTPAGQQDWVEKMQAVAAIIQETNDQAGLQALVDSSNYYTMMQRNRMAKFSTLLAAFQGVVDMYGILQFAELGLHKIVNQSKDAFTTEGVNPDCIILPANVPSILSMSDDRNMSAMHAGTDMARYRQDNGGDSYNAFNGLHVFRARPYTLDNDGGTVSPLTHTTQIGKFFVVPCFEPTASASGAVYHVPFKGRTKAYFLASDRWHGINWQEVLQKSGFDDQNDVKLMRILGPIGAEAGDAWEAPRRIEAAGAFPMDTADDYVDEEDDAADEPERAASGCAYAQAVARALHAEHKLPFAEDTMLGYCVPHLAQPDHAATNSLLLSMGQVLRGTMTTKMGMSDADLEALHTSPDGSKRPVSEVANDMFVWHLRDRSNGLYDHVLRSGTAEHNRLLHAALRGMGVRKEANEMHAKSREARDLRRRLEESEDLVDIHEDARDTIHSMLRGANASSARRVRVAEEEAVHALRDLDYAVNAVGHAEATRYFRDAAAAADAAAASAAAAASEAEARDLRTKHTVRMWAVTAQRAAAEVKSVAADLTKQLREGARSISKRNTESEGHMEKMLAHAQKLLHDMAAEGKQIAERMATGGKDGKDGGEGRQGERGRDGRDGRDAHVHQTFVHGSHIYYDWLVYMPFMEFSTSSVIVCKSGDILGNTFIGHVDTMMSDETISKMHYAHVTAWTNSVVYDRRQLMIFNDAFVQEYLNGANDTFINWNLHADEMQSGDPSAVFRRHGASLIAIPVPVGALCLEDKVSNINNPISITGEVPGIFQEYIQPGALDTAHIGSWMYQTAEIQDAINLRRRIAGQGDVTLPIYNGGAGHRISRAASKEFGFGRMNTTEKEQEADKSYHESNLASNVMLYRASQQLRNPISGQWETNIINSGHFSGCGQYMGALELCNGGFGVAPQEIVRKDPRARILV